MAAKIRIMKLLQEVRGLALITNRRPPARHVGLFLMQIRSNSQRPVPTRQKLVIPIDIQEPTDIPNPVKITHIKTKGSSWASHPGS